MHMDGSLYKRNNDGTSIIKQFYTGILWKAKNEDVHVMKTDAGTEFFRIYFEDGIVVRAYGHNFKED